MSGPKPGSATERHRKWLNKHHERQQRRKPYKVEKESYDNLDRASTDRRQLNVGSKNKGKRERSNESNV